MLEAWVPALKACVLEAWVLAEVLLGAGRLFKKSIIGGEVRSSHAHLRSWGGCLASKGIVRLPFFALSFLASNVKCIGPDNLFICY